MTVTTSEMPQGLPNTITFQGKVFDLNVLHIVTKGATGSVMGFYFKRSLYTLHSTLTSNVYVLWNKGTKAGTYLLSGTAFVEWN